MPNGYFRLITLEQLRATCNIFQALREGEDIEEVVEEARLLEHELRVLAEHGEAIPVSVVPDHA